MRVRARVRVQASASAKRTRRMTTSGKNRASTPSPATFPLRSLAFSSRDLSHVTPAPRPAPRRRARRYQAASRNWSVERPQSGFADGQDDLAEIDGSGHRLLHATVMHDCHGRQLRPRDDAVRTTYPAMRKGTEPATSLRNITAPSPSIRRLERSHDEANGHPCPTRSSFHRLISVAKRSC